MVIKRLFCAILIHLIFALLRGISKNRRAFRTFFKDGNYLLEVSTSMTATYKPADGKIARIETNAKSTDSWLKTKGGWKENAQTLHSPKVFVDGKEIPR